ncbi:MAG TPA: hypothetical protein PKM88_16640, partial [bacterium]|nr:hypothetical protein [bacterium]
MFKSYQGNNRADIMRQIKEELGPEAIIVSEGWNGRQYEVKVQRPAHGTYAPLPVTPALEPAAAAAAVQAAAARLTKRAGLLTAPVFGTKAAGVSAVGQRVVDVLSGASAWPQPAVSGVVPAVAAAAAPAPRPLTYGPQGTAVPTLTHNPAPAPAAANQAPAKPEAMPPAATTPMV